MEGAIPVSGIERRRDERISLGSVECAIRIRTHRRFHWSEVEVVPVRAKDVSRTGVGFTAEPSHNLEVGTEVTFLVNGTETLATIRRVSLTNGRRKFFGAEFGGTSPTAFDEILRSTHVAAHLLLAS